MKTKILFLLGLFICIAVLPAKAQENASQWWAEQSTVAGVWCEGEMIDKLEGTVRAHIVFRNFKNGSLILRNIQQFKGELTSPNTGEVFTFNRMMSWELSDTWRGVIHYNMKGDKGSMYSGKIYVDYSSGVPVFTELHVKCH